MTKVEKSNNLIAPDSISVCTRETDYQFGFFLHGKSSEAFDLISQLTNLAMRRLMLDGVVQDTTAASFINRSVVPKRVKKLAKNSSALKRNLDASKICEDYQMKFNVPITEKLDGKVIFSQLLLKN